MMVLGRDQGRSVTTVHCSMLPSMEDALRLASAIYFCIELAKGNPQRKMICAVEA